MEKRDRIIELLKAVRYTTNDIEKVADEICLLSDVVERSEQLKAFGKSLQYKGVRILTDQGVEQAVKDFESL
jgi:hypothetical protein